MRLVAARVAAMLQEDPDLTARQVAILLRRRQVLPELEAALTAAAVPYRVGGGIGFFQRQEIRDMRSLLAFLRDRGDGPALAAVLRSPLVGLSDEALLYLALKDRRRGLWENLEAAARGEPWPQDAPSPPAELRGVFEAAGTQLARWRVMAGRVPAAQLVARVAEESGLWAVFAARGDGGQAAGNLDKLVGLLRGVPGDLSAVSAFLERQVQRENREGDAAVLDDEADAVRVLTVHAAKGLEFDVVVVPDLGRELQARDSDAVLVDPDGALAFGPPDWRRHGPTKGQAYAYLRARRRRAAQARAEEKRLFYVACTRARRRLVLAAALEDWSPPERGRSWLDWTRRALGIDEEALEAGQVEAFGVEVPLHREADVLATALAAAEIPEGDPGEDVGPEADPRQEPHAVLVLDRVAEVAGDREPPEVARRAREPLRFRRPPPTLSPTQVADYACPRFFELRHRLGLDPARRRALLPVPDPAPGSSTSASGGARVGDAAHRALEAWLHAPDAVERGLDAWEREAPELAPEARREVRAEALELVERFRSTSLADRLRKAATQGKLEAEVPFSLGLEETTLVGSVDVAFRDERWGWTVLDWKTTRAPDEDPDWLERVAAGFRPQLMTYALALRRLRGLRGGVTLALAMLRAGTTWRRKVPGDELDAFQEELEAVVDGVASRRFHREDALVEVSLERCSGCSFRGVCGQRRLAV
jgi:ATP-dependent helicase/nuclease subunit A